MKSAASKKAVLTRWVVLCKEFIHKLKCAASGKAVLTRGVVLCKEFILKNEVCCFKKSGLNKRGGLMQGVHSQE